MSDKTYAERFGTPSSPDGCPVLIAAALTKVETENAALRAALDQQANYQRELKADRDRLDWLAVTNVWFDEPATEAFTPETFRAEIDRKRKDNP